MEIIFTIIPLIGSLLAGILSYLAARRIKRNKEKESIQRKTYSKIFDELWNTYYIDDIESELKDKYKYIDFLYSFRPKYEKAFRNILAHTPVFLTEAEVEDKVKKQLDEIKNRVEQIEKRFPEESTLEKIASVNDAILGTTVETLSESIKRIEEKLLTKWDVAKIVFQILSGLGILIGIVFAIINFILK
ncbi:MAG: hypothetical protein ACFFDN_47610 [Candidatus Hodarchaeota archaeon]